MSRRLEWFKSWEGLLLILFVVTVVVNTTLAPNYLRLDNWINLFELSIEKIIVALAMTFIIINAEIDLSVASVMGLSAGVLAWMHVAGYPFVLAIVVALLVGVLCGAFNGFWIAYVGLPSLVVTLATLIMYRGGARILLEDKSIGDFPAWFDRLGQQPMFGPFPLALILFVIGAILALILLQYAGFGRKVYVIGNNRDVAEYSGVKVRRVKMLLYIASATVAAFAGLLFAARLGAVRGDLAQGFELDIITIVLLGGVSIFGGSGTLTGVLLAILIVLNIRNGMSLLNMSQHMQTGAVGILLILSVLVPNMVTQVRTTINRRRLRQSQNPLSS
ncbi:MAG: ABC transporter permease [Caldilineales bacterium]|nr:ABC transporter permease [Caldilineales bacterium]